MEDSSYTKLNLIEENDYRYELQDIEKPNLFKESMDYDSIPKTTFNLRRVPMYFPEEIWITDTTFRDGQQSRTPFSVSRLWSFTSSFQSSAERRESSARANFLSIPKKTEKPSRNARRLDINSRRLQPG